MRVRWLVLAIVAALAVPATVRAQSPTTTPSPTPTSTPTATPSPTPTPTSTPTPAKRTKAVKRVYSDYQADGTLSACRHTTRALKATLRTITAQFESDFPDFRPAVKAAIKRHQRGGCDQSASNPSGGTTSPGAGATATPAPTVTPAPTATAAPTATTGSLGSTGSESGQLPGGIPHSGGGAKPPKQADIPSAESPGAAATPGTPTTIAPAVTPTPSPRLVVERAGHGDLALPGALLGLALLVAVVLALSAFLAARSPRLAGMHHAWREAAYRTRGTWRDFSEWLRLGR